MHVPDVSPCWNIAEPSALFIIPSSHFIFLTCTGTSSSILFTRGKHIHSFTHAQ